jgi:hypothetical protein
MGGHIQVAVLIKNLYNIYKFKFECFINLSLSLSAL